MGELTPVTHLDSHREKREGRQPFQHAIALRVPDMLDPAMTSFAAYGSREDTQFGLAIPAKPGETEPPAITQANISAAMRNRREVRLFVHGQQPGDTVTVCYNGETPDGNFVGVGETYSYTRTFGWKEVTSAIAFDVATGPVFPPQR